MAGGWARCPCGQNVAVPSLRDLRTGRRSQPALPLSPERPPVSDDLAIRAEPSPIDEWKLACACGARIRITPEQAGTWVLCVCGRSQSVPTLHQLRTHPPIEASTAFSTAPPPPEMPAVAQASIDVTRDVVRAQIAAGASDQQILAELSRKGTPPDWVADEIEDLRETHFRDFRERAMRNMVLGIVWLILGITVTLLTYGLTAIAGWGVYLIAWGAMLGGTVEFFLGLCQLIDAPSREARHHREEGE
jgi:hypothetical protein